MDRERLMKLYARLYASNHSNDKPLKLADELKQEVYDICMTEGANTDNYSPDGTSGFVSACSSMQMIYNALLQDVSSCLYSDGDFFVTACEQGICLGKYDKKRGVILNRTFVSIDMLKDSQMQAWEKINRYISLALEVKHEYGLYSDRFQNLLREIPVEMSLSIDEARSIYASFYDHAQDDSSAIEG